MDGLEDSMCKAKAKAKASGFRGQDQRASHEDMLSNHLSSKQYSKEICGLKQGVRTTLAAFDNQNSNKDQLSLTNPRDALHHGKPQTQ